jgi:hypothetical protein
MYSCMHVMHVHRHAHLQAYIRVYAYMHRVECVLSPGDAVHIPALWFHSTTSIGFSVGGMCVAVLMCSYTYPCMHVYVSCILWRL